VQQPKPASPRTPREGGARESWRSENRTRLPSEGGHHHGDRDADDRPPLAGRGRARLVDELAHGLLALGVRKGDAFAILASTRIEWVLFDFALALVGGVTAPIYMNSSARDVAYVLAHSEAIGVLCEDDEQRQKIAGVGLEHVLTFADLDDLRARGREHAEHEADAVERVAAEIGEDDLYTYIYTSGTTGPPKGCMIRHRNYYSMTNKVNGVDAFTLAGDVMLLFLPLAHNFGRCMALGGAQMGYTVAFCPDPYAVADALPVVRPTVFPSVPRVYEKVHTGITTKFGEETGVKRALIEWALEVGRCDTVSPTGSCTRR
jgi:long-chain acyl-CoA synthetase